MKASYLYIALVVLVIAGLVATRQFASSKLVDGSSPSEGVAEQTPLDTFAQCISDSGAKFYGAYWCSHCQAQKAAFKDSKKLPYIECSTVGGQTQTKACIDAQIETYPTWEFADGSRLTGEQKFATLAEKTGCVAPQE